MDDAARAIVLAAQKHDKPDPVNIGSCMEITIKELVDLIAELTDFEGEIIWDTSKPDGQPRRMLDVSVAEVTNGDKIFLVKTGESTFVPAGTIHRLANPPDVPLEVIEVQNGDYLNESDIIRCEDNFHRGSP